MEEDGLNESLEDDELEARLYAVVHYADSSSGAAPRTSTESAVPALHHPRPQLKRYWRTSNDSTPLNSLYHKVNSQNALTSTPKLSQPVQSTSPSEPDMKEEKDSSVNSISIEDIFRSPIPATTSISIEILKDDKEKVVELETSDEDEVVEVALPPKPTICIESSEEDEVELIPTVDQHTNGKVSIAANKTVCTKSKASNERSVSASPVPSVVSSVSDEFIRSDCLALQISKHTEQAMFDFNLHGTDLLDNTTNNILSGESKKRKRQKKDKTNITATTNLTPTKDSTPEQQASPNDEYFATPKNKAKKKRKAKTKYLVTEQSTPNPDVYESDSNQSAATDAVLELPPTPEQTTLVVNTLSTVKPTTCIVDLTDKEAEEGPLIEDNLIMGNVTGFTEQPFYEDNGDSTCGTGSSYAPDILKADLDFDWLVPAHVGNSQKAGAHRFSYSSLRADMDKFYNESWGGEDFNHRDIQKGMSRDKSLWVIDQKDRLPTPVKRRATCNVCGRTGHRDDRCRHKPVVCHMCGERGHHEPRCPYKMCMNCGANNHLYSSSCRACTGWTRVQCSVCRSHGHPAPHCPDLWRRYHHTVEMEVPRATGAPSKKHYELFCSGCARRGHLVHTCRLALPFSTLPIHSPYVFQYKPVYPLPPRESTAAHPPLAKAASKRQSTTQVHLESGEPKRKSICAEDVPHTQESALASTAPSATPAPKPTPSNKPEEVECPDYIPIGPDKISEPIQDSEVSNTSDIVSTAKIFASDELVSKLQSAEGVAWLHTAAAAHRLDVRLDERAKLLYVKGLTCDQEAFHVHFKEWVRRLDPVDPAIVAAPAPEQAPRAEFDWRCDMPKNRNLMLRKLNDALGSLQADLGDPKALHKEWQFLNKNHDKLLKMKIISPKKLNNSRTRVDRTLRRLNMVLLGQAGLGEGSRHLNRLYSLHDDITKTRKKLLPEQLREEVGWHYHTIFTARPRTDYAALLRDYYGDRHHAALAHHQRDDFPIFPALPAAKLVGKKRKCKQQKKKTNIVEGSNPSQKARSDQARGNTGDGAEVSVKLAVREMNPYKKKLQASSVKLAMLREMKSYKKKLHAAASGGSGGGAHALLRRLGVSLRRVARADALAGRERARVLTLCSQAQRYLDN